MCRLDGGPGPPELGDDDLERPRIYSDHITDAGVAHLSRLANLTLLTLASKNVTDDTLIHLKDLSGLTSLTLFQTQASGAGLKGLECLGQLQRLNLRGTPTTDAIVPLVLESMPALEYIDLKKTKVSAEGIERLQQARPDLKIVRDQVR